MKKIDIALFKLIILNILIQSFNTIAQPSFVWAKSITIPSIADNIFARGIAVDLNGNVYTTGTYRGTINIPNVNPGLPSTFNTIQTDVFVIKQDATGNFLWARGVGGVFADLGYDITTDNSGNVYVSGVFSQTVDFDPGVGTYNLTSTGGYDAFVLKLDASGNFIWVKTIEGKNNALAFAVKVDFFGNVYTAGNFVDTADFDPSTGIYNMVSSGSFNTGIPDAFVLKLDVSGNFVWAKSMGGVGYEQALDIALDGSNNVYITGNYADTADFDPGTSTYNLISKATSNGQPAASIFVSKLDVSGNFVWAKSMDGGSESGYLTKGESIATDSIGNVYFSGTFSDTVDFNPGTGVYNLVSHGYYENDDFICKLDASGNFIWAKSWGIFGNDFAWGMTVDSSGNSYTVGEYVFEVDIDPSVGNYKLISPGGGAAYVNKLDASGNFLCAASLGGKAGTASSKAVAVDGTGNIHTTGFYGKFISDYVDDFNPSNCEFNLSGSGMFISKLGLCTARELPSSSPLIFCIGDSTTLNAGFGYASYQWFPGGETSQKITVKTSGTYSVITTGECTDTLPSFVVTVNTSPPAAVITPSGPTSFCWGDNVILDAGTNYLSYHWLPYGDTTQTIKVENTNSYSITATGPYSVIIDNGCGIDTATIQITITYSQFVNAGADVTICQGTSAMLNGSLSSGGSNPYWLFPIPWDTLQKLSDHGILNPQATPASSKIYILTATNGICYDLDSVMVTVLNYTVNAGSNLTVCLGSNALLTAESKLSYTWSPSKGLSNTTGTMIIAVPTITTLYFLNAISSEGCIITDSVLLTVAPLPVAYAGSNNTITLGNSVILTATGGETYNWNNGNTASSISVSPLNTQNYCVTVSNSYGCEGSHCVQISIAEVCGDVFIPKAFSPNNDQINDFLYLQLQANCIQQLDFKIFDRWGNKVFESNKIMDGWDGTYKGKALDASVFVYYVNAVFTSGEIINRKGNITLMK